MDQLFGNICMRKVENLKFCINELDKCYSEIAVELRKGGGRITGDEIIKAADIIAFYGEAYLLNFNSFLDVLARGFTKPQDRVERNDKKRKIYFHRWLPYQNMITQGDHFLMDVKNEWDSWMKDVMQVRHHICHENSLRVMINNFLKTKWSKETKILEIKRYTINLDGREIELYYYIKDTHKKLEDFLDNIVDPNWNNEYNYPDQATRKRQFKSHGIKI